MKRLNVVKLQMVKESTFPYEVNQIFNPSNAVKLIKDFIGPSDREHAVLIGLDVRNKVCFIHTLSIGTISASYLHPREIFKTALLGNAASIILGHNHPSGNITPSTEDIEVTRRVRDAGEMMGIELLDHLIVGDDNHYSMKEAGIF